MEPDASGTGGGEAAEIPGLDPLPTDTWHPPSPSPTDGRMPEEKSFVDSLDLKKDVGMDGGCVVRFDLCTATPTYCTSRSRPRFSARTSCSPVTPSLTNT